MTKSLHLEHYNKRFKYAQYHQQQLEEQQQEQQQQLLQQTSNGGVTTGGSDFLTAATSVNTNNTSISSIEDSNSNSLSDTPQPPTANSSPQLSSSAVPLSVMSTTPFGELTNKLHSKPMSVATSYSALSGATNSTPIVNFANYSSSNQNYENYPSINHHFQSHMPSVFGHCTSQPQQLNPHHQQQQHQQQNVVTAAHFLNNQQNHFYSNPHFSNHSIQTNGAFRLSGNNNNNNDNRNSIGASSADSSSSSLNSPPASSSSSVSSPAVDSSGTYNSLNSLLHQQQQHQQPRHLLNQQQQQQQQQQHQHQRFLPYGSAMSSSELPSSFTSTHFAHQAEASSAAKMSADAALSAANLDVSTASTNEDGSLPIKKRRPVPVENKDNTYWEKRRKNNESAKRSRDIRRSKEEIITTRVVYLEQENLGLRTQVALLKSQNEKLQALLYSSGANSNNMGYNGNSLINSIANK